VCPDPDHAEILRRGPTAWNAWREENPSIVPDLAGITLKLSHRQMGPINGGHINLRSALLQAAMLRFATLSVAELENADLSGADLVHARLDRSNLRAANLSNAQLDHASFAEADLTNATLCGASLSFTNLTAADLEAADMSGADFAHARFDNANLRAANLSSAFLEHADFAGTNLAKANLCGANLYHAKNLTETQLEETIRSDSTILPAHLHGSISSSAVSLTESPALEHRDERRQVPYTVPLDVRRIRSHRRPAWIGVLLIGGALVTTGFVWERMNDRASLDKSPPQEGSGQSLSQPKPSSNTGVPRLQSSPPESLIDEKAAGERQQSAETETPPAASTVDRTESVPAQVPSAESVSPAAVQETNANGDLQASDGALNEQAPGTGNQGYDEASEASRIEGSVAPSRHGTLAALPTEPFEASAPESPVTMSRHGTVPDLPTEASIRDPQLTPDAAGPASALAPSTSGHSAAASPLSDTVLPPVVTAALPSSVEQRDAETVLHHDAGSPPIPLRKPVTKTGVSNPGGAETSPKPVRKSVAQTDRSRRGKGQSLVDEKDQKTGSGSIVDLLAGGL
jgi:uncharacterized protein YjbI with pentapeptide repeats